MSPAGPTAMSSQSTFSAPGTASWASSFPAVSIAKTRAESPESLWVHRTFAWVRESASPESSLASGAPTWPVTVAFRRPQSTGGAGFFFAAVVFAGASGAAAAPEEQQGADGERWLIAARAWARQPRAPWFERRRSAGMSRGQGGGSKLDLGDNGAGGAACRPGAERKRVRRSPSLPTTAPTRFAAASRTPAPAPTSRTRAPTRSAWSSTRRSQNVTDLGLVDFLTKEPARVAAAVDKCFYYQVDHWTGSVVQGQPPELWHWDGHYYFDMARGVGGVYVENVRIGGQPADPRLLPGFPTAYWPYFGPGGGGVQLISLGAATPDCQAKVDTPREARRVYRHP